MSRDTGVREVWVGIWSIETTLRRGLDSYPFLPNSKILVPSIADNFPKGINRMHQNIKK